MSYISSDPGWDVKKVFGLWDYNGQVRGVFKVWRPLVWNTLCVVQNTETGKYKLFLNGETVIKHSNLYDYSVSLDYYHFMNFKGRFQLIFKINGLVHYKGEVHRIIVH